MKKKMKKIFMKINIQTLRKLIGSDKEFIVYN